MSDATTNEQVTAPQGTTDNTVSTNESPEGTGQETKQPSDDKALESALAQKKHFREKAEAAEAKLKEIEEAKLRDQEEWKTIAETKEAEVNEWKSKYEGAQTAAQNQLINNALIQELSKHNPVSIEDAVKLADLSSVEVVDGTVTGVQEAVSSLVESKGFLFGTQVKPVNSGASAKSTGTATGEKRTYTRAQIAEMATNPEEFAKHEKDIGLAYREGRVID